MACLTQPRRLWALDLHLPHVFSSVVHVFASSLDQNYNRNDQNPGNGIGDAQPLSCPLHEAP